MVRKECAIIAIVMSVVFIGVIVLADQVETTTELVISDALAVRINKQPATQVLQTIYGVLRDASETQAATALVEAVSVTYAPLLADEIAKRQAELDKERSDPPIEVKSATKEKKKAAVE